MKRNTIIQISVIIIGIAIILNITERKNVNLALLQSIEKSSNSTPPRGVESSSMPLGYPSGVPISDSHSFLNYQRDLTTPVAWDPCRPIHYVINESNMPENGISAIADAFAIYSKITGYKFIYDGLTDEFYNTDRKSYQPEKYGDRWAPILVTWSTITNRPDLPENVLGEGGATYASRSGTGKIYVSGIVDLQIDHLRKNLGNDKAAGKFNAVILHEIGHALGLGHSKGAWNLMYPEDRLTVNELSLGDKAGLYILASQKCYPEI